MKDRSGTPARRAKIKRIVPAVAAAGIIFALALFHYFLPLRTLLPAYPVPARGEGELRLHFLDVGQGDCTIVEFPEGDVLVVDAGDGGWKNNNTLLRYLKGLNPSALSLLATHADSDHIGGFPAVFEAFDVKETFFPAVPSQSLAYRRFTEAAQRSGCECKTLTRYGIVSRDSGAYAVCLSPYSQGETDENDSSAVLWLQYGGVSALLCGDITSGREGKLLRENGLDETLFDKGEFTVRLADTDILKTAHHGSDNASSGEWLSLLGAKTAVVSCGRGNGYSHPAGGALERLSAAGMQIYRTDELGHIVICVKDGGYSVKTHFV